MKVALREAKVPFLVFYVAFFDTISPGLCGSLTFSHHFFPKKAISENCIFLPTKPISMIERFEVHLDTCSLVMVLKSYFSALTELKGGVTFAN